MAASRQMAFLAVSLAALAVSAARRPLNLGFDPESEPQKAASAYIAPESSIIYRLRYPNGSYREFEYDAAHPNRLMSGAGWLGWLRGDMITVRTGPDTNGVNWVWTFRDGTAISFGRKNGGKIRFPLDAPREIAGSVPPYHFGDEHTVGIIRNKAKERRFKGLDSRAARLITRKWAKSGRLRWPFSSPNENGCLYASLALLAAFALFSSKLWVKIAGGSAFLLFMFMMAATASRGAFLAFALAMAPTLALNAKKLLRSKAAWTLTALVAVCIAAWVCTHDVTLLTRGFTRKSAWSNSVRLEMWKTAPQMMADAPGGWGFTNVGRAYMDWYQDLDELSMPGSLMNDHLTRLVGIGWQGRFWYLFAWLAGLGILYAWGCRTRNALPAGAWTLLAVAGWFNPMYHNIVMWIPPMAATALFLAMRPWKTMCTRDVAWPVVGAAALAAALLGLTALSSSDWMHRRCPVRVEGDRVYVKGIAPRTWIVDDARSLGGIMACKEIRAWYSRNRGFPSVGYVRNVKSLPEGKIHRLVLAGKAGHEWLKLMSDGGAAAQRNVPDEVVFLSPPFPPAALPPGFLKSCKVTLAVGEFYTRYYPDEYKDPPPWVDIVKGAELYFPGWMRYADGR